MRNSSQYLFILTKWSARLSFQLPAKEICRREDTIVNLKNHKGNECRLPTNFAAENMTGLKGAI
jgi:hypothetical protein